MIKVWLFIFISIGVIVKNLCNFYKRAKMLFFPFCLNLPESLALVYFLSFLLEQKLMPSLSKKDNFKKCRNARGSHTSRQNGSRTIFAFFVKIK